MRVCLCLHISICIYIYIYIFTRVVHSGHALPTVGRALGRRGVHCQEGFRQNAIITCIRVVHSGRALPTVGRALGRRGVHCLEGFQQNASTPTVGGTIYAAIKRYYRYYHGQRSAVRDWSLTLRSAGSLQSVGWVYIQVSAVRPQQRGVTQCDAHLCASEVRQLQIATQCGWVTRCNPRKRLPADAVPLASAVRPASKCGTEQIASAVQLGHTVRPQKAYRCSAATTLASVVRPASAYGTKSSVSGVGLIIMDNKSIASAVRLACLHSVTFLGQRSAAAAGCGWMTCAVLSSFLRWQSQQYQL